MSLFMRLSSPGFPQQILLGNLTHTGVPRPHASLKNWHRRCSTSSQSYELEKRRSANHFKPTIWSYDMLKSLNNGHNETSKDKAKKLEEQVTLMIDNHEGMSQLKLLELIDDVERLGLGYLFKEQIMRALDVVVTWKQLNVGAANNVHTTALRFRLLRQHGYEVSEEVFRSLKDHSGNFMHCLQNDARGLLSLYEATFLAFEGEKLLDEAKSFARLHLKHLKACIDKQVVEEVNQALDLPLHYRMPRLEARRYIDVYSRNKYAYPSLLELAAFDFNKVQSVLQGDLKNVTWWWESIGLASKLNFIRDRPMECFFWAAGVAFKPEHSNCRIGLMKVTSLITTIDDVYDIYGSLDELQLFTKAVEKWDISVVETLPNYMKLCFLALYNTVNDMGYSTLKEHEENIIPVLSRAWADLCQAFLQEAKWNHHKCTPTFEDYLYNAWKSVSGVLVLVHAYFLMGQSITNEAIVCVEKPHDLLKWSFMVFRLCNDLGTSKAEIERGETANSITSCMHDTGLSAEHAREHLRNMIDEVWKKMNKDCVVNSLFDESFIEATINLARFAHCTYQYGDGHGDPNVKSKNRVMSLIIEPIILKEREGNTWDI